MNIKKNALKISPAIIILFLLFQSLVADASKVRAAFEGGMLINESLQTNLLPKGELQYSIWEPSSYIAKEPTPLIIYLHGGGGSRDRLKRVLPVISQMMRKNKFPSAIWSTPSMERSFYMNYKDGSNQWETVFIDHYLPMLMERYDISDSSQIVIVGVSMGGMGGLRLAFKHSEKFGAVAVLEPAIEATLSWEKISESDTFYRKNRYERIFGKPVDPKYWESNNPASIAAKNPRALDKLNIYFDVGDADQFKLYRGGEFLHRVLFDKAVKHEYTLVHDADHINKEFLNLRLENLLGFVNRHFYPIRKSFKTKLFSAGLNFYAGEQDFSKEVPLASHRE